MPDRPNSPSDWAGAFAALPAETPPADGWTRLADRLAEQRAAAAPAAVTAATARPAPSSHRRWALAAMLAAALPLGLWLGLRAQRPALDSVAPDPFTQQSAQPAAAQREPAPQTAAMPANADDRTAATADRVRAPASDPAVPATTPTPAAADTNQRRFANASRESKPRAGRAADSPTQSGVAQSGLAANPAQAGSARIAAASDDARLDAQLRELQAESAQLEALVAAARDERVASATAAVMSAGLDQRLRLIDGALLDTALPAASRVSLWRDRVDALRSLAGVESTQRWFAARGERYDGALVRVD